VAMHVSLVGRKDLKGEIYRQLRVAIRTGQLRPGEYLSPSRQLAQALAVSRSTVVAAYDRLAAEGFLTSRPGGGTLVSGDLVRAKRGARTRSDDALRPRPIWESIGMPTVFDRAARFDFRTGLPDAALFPHKTWRRLVARALRLAEQAERTYQHPAGQLSLRVAIAHHIGVSRGIEASADDIVITCGTQQALDVLARVLLSPGDRIAVEDPGYLPPRQLFHSLAVGVTGVPVDRDGLVVDALPDRVRAIYVTPSHQYPLGVTMSLPRRRALLAWAERLRQRVPVWRSSARAAEDARYPRSGDLPRLILENVAANTAYRLFGEPPLIANRHAQGDICQSLARADRCTDGTSPSHRQWRLCTSHPPSRPSLQETARDCCSSCKARLRRSSRDHSVGHGPACGRSGTEVVGRADGRYGLPGCPSRCCRPEIVVVCSRWHRRGGAGSGLWGNSARANPGRVAAAAPVIR
jgi:DNA-binding transcriptional regulator YhcF (GntR family)